MYYRLTLNGETYERTFYFQIESENKQRWANMRLIKIVDNPPFPGQEGVVYYDPTIHTPEKHHYMSHTWRARYHHATEVDDHIFLIESYWLYGAFGNPGSRINLEATETLD